MNNGKPQLTIRANYERICLIKNDLAWIKKGMLGIGGMIALNIVIGLIV